MVVAIVLAWPGLVWSAGLGNGIFGSPHDFTDLNTNGWNRTEELCRSCHIPHDHDREIYPAGLLWNHEVTSQQFTPYTMFDGTTAGQPVGDTKLCLGCHDGTVGVDEWDGRNQGAGTVFIEDYALGAMVPGQSMQFSMARTHPVSIPYQYDPADRDGLNDPHSTPMGASGVIADVLNDGKIECTTCHDIHDRESVGGTWLLRAPMKNIAGRGFGSLLGVP